MLYKVKYRSTDENGVPEDIEHAAELEDVIVLLGEHLNGAIEYLTIRSMERPDYK